MHSSFFGAGASDLPVADTEEEKKVLAEVRDFLKAFFASTPTFEAVEDGESIFSLPVKRGTLRVVFSSGKIVAELTSYQDENSIRLWVGSERRRFARDSDVFVDVAFAKVVNIESEEEYTVIQFRRFCGI